MRGERPWMQRFGLQHSDTTQKELGVENQDF
jgi:hypothetical protein